MEYNISCASLCVKAVINAEVQFDNQFPRPYCVLDYVLRGTKILRYDTYPGTSHSQDSTGHQS